MTILAARASGFLPQSTFAAKPFRRQQLGIFLLTNRWLNGPGSSTRSMYIPAGTSSDDNEMNSDFESVMPLPPFGSKNGAGIRPPSKGDIYSDDDLLGILELHKGLSDQMITKGKESSGVGLPGEEPPSAGIASLHDMVLQTIEDMEKDNIDQTSESSSEDNQNKLQQRVAKIAAIASDVDGTLLSSEHTLHPRTEQAIRQAVAQVNALNDDNLQYFFPATGKSRKGALDSLGTEIRALLENLPGVFIQGLYCIDGDGTVIFERKLSSEAVEKGELLGKQHGVTLLGYDGDNLYHNADGDPILCAEINEKWGEPRPIALQSLMDHENGFHKLLLVHHDVDKLNEKVRPNLQTLADASEASVTVAIPTMLELLPRGCSKALGVEKLCQHLGVNPSTQLLAIGDAENDVGMLEMAAIGVAVGNGSELAKQAADIVMKESNNEGGAGLAMELYSSLLSRK